jgi:DNA-directed RNA polymerase III subunit RPC2
VQPPAQPAPTPEVPKVDDAPEPMEVDGGAVQPPGPAPEAEQDGNPQASTAPEQTRKRRAPLTHGKDEFAALLEPFYYGKSLTDPINTARDKWNLLPAFLKVKGLVKQHVDSYNHFVDVDLKKIIKANRFVRSEFDPKFLLEYTDIRILSPNRQEEDDLEHPQYRHAERVPTPRHDIRRADCSGYRLYEGQCEGQADRHQDWQDARHAEEQQVRACGQE